MNKNPAQESVGGVEQIISELHERGVKSGKAESERLLAEARVKAAEVVRAAETERDRIVADGSREALRITEAAQAEAAQMLEAFMAALPDIFEKRATRLLDAILANAFDPQRDSETIDQFVACLDGERTAKIKAHFATARPQSFLEGLLVMATAFYADTAGVERFTLDSHLKRSWAALMGGPMADSSVGYEFRDGILGFAAGGRDGREIAVSAESVQHMAREWAGEEFRDIYLGMTPKPAGEGAG